MSSEGIRVAVSPSSPKDALAQSARAKLLLVDDDANNLLALQAVLEPLGQELMLAASGTDALRLCLDNDFAAILLDVSMPGMDGFETAELIRARDRSRHTPVLFLTAYRSDEHLFRGYDLGAVDFLFKPIVPEILQSKVAVFVNLAHHQELLRLQAAELRRTEQKFRAVLEGAPDAMLITRRDGSIELANSRTDALFGYPRETLIGMNIHALIPEWECPQGNQGGGAMETRLKGFRADHTQFPAEITSNPFVAGSGEDAHLITTAVRDATVQVEAEERIRQINVELERRVEDRTAALTRSNDALRQFAWASSHDLQEPVRTVLAYSQWLAQHAGGNLDEKAARMIETIGTSAEHMDRLLGALRQYIFISESSNEESSRVDANRALKSALANIDGLVQETQAVIEANDLPHVRAQEITIVQVFQNLVGNALKYRSEARPVVRIWADRAGDGWQFSVLDNGIGIEPKYAEYVFGVFKRLHGQKFSGTGIGLAICKVAVERLGGRIWVESKVGEGSCFRFYLPDGV
jgi:PAS domain S-box-containing protein